MLLLLLAQRVSGQDHCKDAERIAFYERPGQLNGMAAPQDQAASANYDVTYYRCEWEVDPAQRFIAGKVTVYYRVKSASNTLSLDLMSGFTIDSIRQRNTALAWQYAANILDIQLRSLAAAGLSDSFSVYYRGVPPNTGFGSFVQTQHNGIPVLWTLSEPYGSRDWWPCKNGLDDKADSADLYITTPVAYKAASNGLLQSETLTAGGTRKTAWWKHRYPVASYLLCFAVTNYSVFNSQVTLGPVTLPVQTYCYPENLASFQQNVPALLDAIRFYHERFGPYPFLKEKYGQVQFSWGGGMEHQTASFVVNADEGLMAHELAHQWFGDKVTCGSWEDIWLNEGFATHLTSMYLEQKYPATARDNRRNEINEITAVPGGSVRVDDTLNVGRIFDWRLSYLKGSHLLYMLRWIIGDSAFIKGSGAYLSDPRLAYGFARTADLRKHLEQASGKDLGYFFTQWFSGQGFPSYQVEWSPLGSEYVKIKVSQTSSHPSVPFFTLPLPLQFRSGNRQKTIVLPHQQNGEIFIRSIGFIPDTVLIDPDYWLISRNNQSRRKTEPAGGSASVQVFPNPAPEQVYVWLRDFTATTASIRLINNAGQALYSRVIALRNGSEFINIPTRYLASGIYYLQVRTPEGFQFSRKILH